MSTGFAISVVIPNHNGGQTLGECLEAVYKTGYPGLEVILVDDASNDDSLKIAGRFPVRVIRHEKCRGAAAARNSGAAAVGGEIVLFIDSDVIIPRDTFKILREDLADPKIAGVVGLLRPFTRFGNLCSQYKNFYMHYTYRQLPALISVFYTSIAAIRRTVFDECGGFDERYRSATIEDTEFGVRITGRGHRLLLDQRLQVDHVRRYDLKGLLKTGFRRAGGITLITIRDRNKPKSKSSYLTTSTSFLAGIVLSGLIVLFPILALVFSRPVFLAGAAAAWLAILALNRGFIAGLGRRRTVFFLTAALLLPADLLVHGAGAAWGAISFLLGKRC